MSIPVTGIDHAVFWVRDVEKTKDFYVRVFGMKEVAGQSGMVLLRAVSNQQHHNIGLFQASVEQPPRARGAAGLFHLAWKVDSITDLQIAIELLQKEGALTGKSDHGATKSVYGMDPEGNEFEIAYTIPREDWGEWENGGMVAPLDLDKEIKLYS